MWKFRTVDFGNGVKGVFSLSGAFVGWKLPFGNTPGRTNNSQGTPQTIAASGATPAVNLNNGDHIDLTLTTATPAIQNPTGISKGQRVVFILRQDATGGRTPSWGTKYLGASLVTSGTAGQVAVVCFEATDLDLVQTSASAWFTPV